MNELVEIAWSCWLIALLLVSLKLQE